MGERPNDQEMAGVRAGSIVRLGQEGAAERELHLFLGLLGFLHSLHLHLLLFDSFPFLGDEAVNIHTTLETQSEAEVGTLGRGYSEPRTSTKQGHPSLTFCFSESL